MYKLRPKKICPTPKLRRGQIASIKIKLSSAGFIVYLLSLDRLAILSDIRRFVNMFFCFLWIKGFAIFVARLAMTCILVMPTAWHFFARVKKVPKKHA